MSSTRLIPNIGEDATPPNATFWDDFPRRLAIIVAFLGSPVIDTAPCHGCEAVLTLHATKDLRDTYWTSSNPGTTPTQRHDLLDSLADSNPAAYSVALSHLETYGRIPGEHVCRPDIARATSRLDPSSRFAQACERVRQTADLEGVA